MRDDIDKGLREIDKRLKEAFNTNGNIKPKAPPAEAPAPMPAPVDMLQERRNITRDYAKKSFPRGSRAQVLATVEDVVNGIGTDSLAQAYERAKDNSEAVDKMGDHRRAQIIKNQYMEEKFLPAIEVVVNFTSPDELLNSKKALNALDKYALGTGSMSGYTAAYVREAYGNALGQVQAASSPEVSDAVYRLGGFLDTDQMVLARSLAKRIKKKIDSGDVIASEDDYDFILNIANNWPK